MEKSREATTTCMPESSVGDWARSVRMALELTQLELANTCGVSLEDVYLFEHDLPVRLDARRRLRKQLWATRIARCQTFPR